MRNGAIAALVIVAFLVGAGTGYYIGFTSTRLTSTSVSTTTVTTTASSASNTLVAQGVVTGIVSVGGQVPANISLYSVVFRPTPCSGACSGLLIPIYPSGHYSALLSPGNYTMGLYPSCKWSGCATSFQNPVTVDSGQQIVVNFDLGGS
jgi:hypothetical protein